MHNYSPKISFRIPHSIFCGHGTTSRSLLTKVKVQNIPSLKGIIVVQLTHAFRQTSLLASEVFLLVTELKILIYSRATISDLDFRDYFFRRD